MKVYDQNVRLRMIVSIEIQEKYRIDREADFMRFLNELHEGDRISGIYLCKQKQAAVTKNGKPYENIILQDKTGIMDGKIWAPEFPGN